MFDTSFRTVIGTLGTVVCAGVCLIAATAPARAGGFETPRAIAVGYSDLNLASSHGRSVLDARIRSAARTVCATGSNDLRSKMAADRCLRGALEAAQPKKIAAAADYRG